MTASRGLHLLRVIQGGKPAGGRGRRRARRGRASQPKRYVLLGLFLLALFGSAHLLGVLPWMRDRILAPPARFDLTGIVTIVDGDTLRLEGIDAPEKAATCTAKSTGRRIACGTQAGQELTAIIAGRRIDCLDGGEDHYGRTLATCYVGKGKDRGDIGRLMVRRGWAVAYRRYSNRYAMDEAAARLDGVGLWATEFQTPEDYRRQARTN